jgi:hypothetical protein
LRHDLRELVRLASPPALAAVKAALDDAVANGAGTTPSTGGMPSSTDARTSTPRPSRKRTRR